MEYTDADLNNPDGYLILDKTYLGKLKFTKKEANYLLNSFYLFSSSVAFSTK